jgi:hypothetical protein
VSPAPLRPEPGPRDWSPTGGYTGGHTPAGRAAGRPTRVAPPPRAPRLPRMPVGDYTLGAFLFGLIAIVVAAVYVPDGAQGGTVLISSVGLLAILLAARTRTAWRAGLTRRRRIAGLGGAFGAAALASSAIVLVNGWFGLSIPSIPDATRVTVAAVSQLVDGGVGGAVGAVGGADADQTTGDAPVTIGEPAQASRVPVGAPDPAVHSPEPFATADAEFMRLAQELGTVVFLINQVTPDAAPEALYASHTGYSYIERPNAVMVTHGTWLTTGYGRGADGSYTITMTGAQFGSIAYYQSSVGVIERR